MMMLLASALAGPRVMEVEIEVPVSEPDQRVQYRSSTEVWRVRNGQVLGAFESTHPALSCSVDGRWVRAEVRFSGVNFPDEFPQHMVCQNEDLLVNVSVVQSQPEPEGYVDGRLVMRRSWGTLAKTSVVIPVDGLADSRVDGSVRGVECAVDVTDQTLVSVRVFGTVLAEEATCELPTVSGGTWPLTIELPRD